MLANHPITSRILAVSAVGIAPLCSAQGLLWTGQVGSPSMTFSGAAAPNGAGGVYIGGEVWGTLGAPALGGADAWLAHYDAAGAQVWITQFGTATGDRITGLAPDGSGGVFACGSTHGAIGGPHLGQRDAWLARFDAAGNQLWIRQLGTSEDELVLGAAADTTGGVYLTGMTNGSLGGPNVGASYDAWLARYDGAGVELWSAQIGTTGGDVARTVSADDSGGVFVGGQTDGAFQGSNFGSQDAWCARYTAAGTQTWIRQLGSTESDQCLASACDGAGGLFVTGGSMGSLASPSSGSQDIWLARFDTAGNELWRRQFGTPAADVSSALVMDGLGGVYVGGSSQGDLGGSNMNPGVGDGWIARFDEAGDGAWSTLIGTNNEDYVSALAGDGAGRFFALGSTTGSLGGPQIGGWDAWFARIDGGLVAPGYCGPAVPNSSGFAASLSATGNNYAALGALTLSAALMPANVTCFFLASQTEGFVVGPGTSHGNLCLSGSIGRFVGPGQVLNSGPNGTASLAVDLGAVPTPTGLVAASAGQTWHFQGWFRDLNPGSTSNFTNGVRVSFH